MFVCYLSYNFYDNDRIDQIKKIAAHKDSIISEQRPLVNVAKVLFPKYNGIYNQIIGKIDSLDREYINNIHSSFEGSNGYIEPSYTATSLSSYNVGYEPFESGGLTSLFKNIVYVFFVIIISIFTGLYRYQLKEISKAERYKLGFLRISIAAKNFTEGYTGEVRQSLTQSPFDSLIEANRLFSKNKKVENPIPGNPGLDFSVTLLNKILENLEVSIKK